MITRMLKCFILCFYACIVFAATLVNANASDPIALSWHTYFGYNAQVMDTAVDNDGSLVLLGTALDPFNGPGGQAPLVPFGDHSTNVFVMKLDASANYLWHTFIGASDTYNSEHRLNLAFDSVSNIFVSGISWGGWDGPNAAQPKYHHQGFSFDGYIFKLDPEGRYQWHTFSGSGSNIGFTDITIDSSDNVYVVGVGVDVWNHLYKDEPLHFPDDLPPELEGAGAGHLTHNFILAYNNSGQYRWHTFYGANNRKVEMISIAASLESDETYLYIAGKSSFKWRGSLGQVPVNPISSESVLVDDFFLLKLNAFGGYEWHTFQGSGVDAYLHPLKTVIADQRIYVMGTASKQWLGNGEVLPLRQFQGKTDIFVHSFDRDGNYIWHTYQGSLSLDWGTDIVVDQWQDITLTAGTYNASSATEDGLWLQPEQGLSPLYPYVERANNNIALSLDRSGQVNWYTYLRATDVTMASTPSGLYIGGLTGGSNLIGENTPSPLAVGGKALLAYFNYSQGGETRFYLDFDSDGFGNPDEFMDDTQAPQGYVSNNLDCNDSDSTCYPGAPEIKGDGIDQDCDGSDSEIQTTQDLVTEIYVATFERAPDYEGLRYWCNAFDTGVFTIEQVARSFFDQPETKTKFPEGSSNTEFITAIYYNTLSRTPDAAGLAYWVDTLDSGLMRRDQAIMAIINGAKAVTGSQADADMLARKTEVGVLFGNTLIGSLTTDENFINWARDIISCARSSDFGVDEAEQYIIKLQNSW